MPADLLPSTPFGRAGKPRPRRRGQLQRPFGRLYYEATGEGPAVFFAHGLGGNHMSWWQQVAEFCDRYTCVTFSQRGFAPSDAVQGGPDPLDYVEDLEALIAHLGPADVRVVAQSMGGWCAVEYALRAPKMLKGVVLAATSGTLDPKAADPAAFEAWHAPAVRTQEAFARDGVHAACGRAMVESRPDLHLLYKTIDEIGGANLDKDALRKKLGETRVRPASDLAAVAAPILFVTGSEDVVFPSAVAPALVAAAPNARVVSIEGAGHSAYFERAAEFNEHVGAFLETTI
jgi:3-oxoadipate enol-lactonase